MKNSYALKLKQKKMQEQYDSSQGGFMLAGCLIAVALNNLYGFGKDRLEAVEKESNRILEEEFGGDKEKASYDLVRRLDQIRGKDWAK